MIGISVPCQWHLVQAADLPFVVDAYRPSTGVHLRCAGFRAEDAGTVEVKMQSPKESEAQTHVVPVNTTSGMEWLGDIKSIEAFVTTTKIWLYLTDVFSG